MSRRTSDANKAIAAAWSNEQKLVREGRGTRDWTPQQQRDILDKGKAYDNNGKAFEGHHMKSAERFPEYQGDAKNIQFLARTEHFDAHNGNFQNPTNGYFNPQTGETKDFGPNKYEPCKIIELSEPINPKGTEYAGSLRNNNINKVADGGGTRAPNSVRGNTNNPIYANYGEERARSILSGFSTSFTFRLNDDASREFIKGIFGKNRKSDVFMPVVQTKGLVEEQRDGNVVEDWDITGLRIGEAIVGLPGEEPFVFRFDEYKNVN